MAGAAGPEEIGRACPDPQLGVALELAISELLRLDIALLEVDANELTIASQLAAYLQVLFADWDVDTEYNRDGELPKRLHQWRGIRPVRPDIIVHRRRTRENYLVVELKKSSNVATSEADVDKLLAFREDSNFRYRHGLFLRLGVLGDAGKVVEYCWV